MKEDKLLRFVKTLAGKYSNFEQAQSYPKYFAHINIYFRPLDSSLFNFPVFYSEQSHDISPWSPYRQSIHKVYKRDDTFIVENYSLLDKTRFAGGGFCPEVLNGLNKDCIKIRQGCSMHFIEKGVGHYIGQLESEKSCIINKDGKKSYLISEVEFDNQKWISLDKGFDISSDKQVWGSRNGSFKFKKVLSMGENLSKEWLRS